MITNQHFFLEILKALCRLGTKVNSENFSIMEQKLVKRCETEFVADACNAS